MGGGGFAGRWSKKAERPQPVSVQGWPNQQPHNLPNSHSYFVCQSDTVASLCPRVTKPTWMAHNLPNSHSVYFVFCQSDTIRSWLAWILPMALWFGKWGHYLKQIKSTIFVPVSVFWVISSHPIQTNHLMARNPKNTEIQKPGNPGIQFLLKIWSPGKSGRFDNIGSLVALFVTEISPFGFLWRGRKTNERRRNCLL